MKTVTFDPAQRLNLIFRIGRSGSKKFVFLRVDGDAFDISSIDLQVKIMLGPRSSTETLTLNIGDGLTVGGSGLNELTLSVDGSDTALPEKIYYWELYNNTDKKTWLNGDAYFIQGKTAEIGSDTNITIDTGGEIVQITITDTATSGVLVPGTVIGRGDYDASTNLFPSTGGTGTSGAIEKGNEFDISVAGTLGITAVPIGSTIRAKIDNPGQTTTNWRIYF